jgi:predicted AlkP superfamily pyrophosphatase or phosphodiesterase
MPSSRAASRRLAAPAAGAALALAAACLPPPLPTPTAAAGRVTEHVIVISIDGLRADALERFGATTLLGLARGGSHTLAARTILPAKTLPSHTSMLTGVEPAVHGVTWNSLLDDPDDPYDDRREPDSLRVPTVFRLARDAGLSTAAFFSKAKFGFLRTPGSLDYAQAPRSTWWPWGTQRTSEDAAWYIRHRRPNLVFVHLGEPDYAGHTIGWMTAAYGENVRIADRGVRRIVEAADEAFGAGGYTLLVTADHGGHGRTHGLDTLSDVTIPWIAHGRGVRAGTTIGADVRTTDTAATILWLLGVPVPDAWTGRPVREAYR